LEGAKDLPNLTHLNLSSNLLLNAMDLIALKQLVFLDLSSNKIDRLFTTDKHDSPTFNWLQTLNLNKNVFECLEDINLKCFPALKHLFLNDNRLENVSLIYLLSRNMH
jgi:hypothetical protein